MYARKICEHLVSHKLCWKSSDINQSNIFFNRHSVYHKWSINVHTENKLYGLANFLHHFFRRHYYHLLNYWPTWYKLLTCLTLRKVAWPVVSVKNGIRHQYSKGLLQSYNNMAVKLLSWEMVIRACWGLWRPFQTL